LRIRWSGNPFTEQFPNDSPGIADVFTGRCQATVAVPRVYTPQYPGLLLESVEVRVMYSHRHCRAEPAVIGSDIGELLTFLDIFQFC
jgi:hypothetical protein